MGRGADQLWRTEIATRMRVIVDADDYFRAARSAMLKARRRIMLVGWDFDARIELDRHGREPGEPAAIGEFVLWLVNRNPELEVFLLRWDVGALKTLFRGTTVLTVLKWMRHPRIHTRLDAHHPTGASHHQKIVVIDDCFAFCGGIDMTGERWDTRAHADDEPRRINPNGKPYKPWHDAIAAVEGPVAAALGELSRTRWRRAAGRTLEPIEGQRDCWPEGVEPQFREISVGISRTVPAMPDDHEVREIEALFLAHIAAARESIYAESQYFASRKIAEAIARRLDEPDGPEIVLINPVTAQGWLEPIAMDTARARLMAALERRAHSRRFRMYHPFTAEGDPIYVHAKILVIDGITLRVGSANMNNRSLGLDTECDLVIDAASDADRRAVVDFRNGLLAEHLGTTTDHVADEVSEHGSLIGAIERLRGEGRSLRPYVRPDLPDLEAWLADNELLDPESPEEMFEPLSQRGLFRRLRRPRH